MGKFEAWHSGMIPQGEWFIATVYEGYNVRSTVSAYAVSYADASAQFQRMEAGFRQMNYNGAIRMNSNGSPTE